MKTKTIIGYIVVIIIVIIICKWWCCPKWWGNKCPEPSADSCCTAADRTLPAGYSDYVGDAAIDPILASYNPVTDDSTKGGYIPPEVIKYFNCLDCDSVFAMFVIHPTTFHPTVMYICDSLGILRDIAPGETGTTCPTKCP